VAESSSLLANNPAHKVSELRRRAPKSLAALANLYFQTQVLGQSPHTAAAKRGDLELFLRFYLELYGHDAPDEWYASVTREFLNRLPRDVQPHLGRRFAPATVARVYSTVRHFARWAHAQVPFPMGSPIDGVKPPDEEPGEFKGLSRKDSIRLLAAADSLVKTPGRGTDQTLRNRALVQCLLASALRVSELVALERGQYDGRAFLDVVQKGRSRRKFVPLSAAARQALDTYLEERGSGDGPLFPTRTGKHLSRRQVYDLIKRLEAQANARLPSGERFEVSPQVLRHTRLRRVANERGVQFAQKLAGHKSSKYIWRYVQPSDADLANSLQELD